MSSAPPPFSLSPAAPPELISYVRQHLLLNQFQEAPHHDIRQHTLYDWH